MSAATLGYSALKFYWSVGGQGLRDTIDFPPEVWDDPTFKLLGLWGTVVLGAAGVVVAWMLARPPARLPALLREVLRGLAWGACVLLAVRSVFGLTTDAIGLVSALGGRGSPSRTLWWDLLLYSPYFLLWSLSWGALARRTRPAYPRKPVDH